jgi:hypothetical protein
VTALAESIRTNDVAAARAWLDAADRPGVAASAVGAIFVRV